MAVNKITGFRAPYKSDVLRDIVDSIEGLHALLDMDGPITQVASTITLPAFRVVQDGLIYEKTVATTLTAPALSAPYYLVVTAPTANQIDDLLFTFAKTPEDVADTEVILGAYDGFEWREAQKVSIKGILDLLAQTNKDTLRVGPFDGLRTSLNGSNYDNAPGTLVDRQGEPQAFNETASFPVVGVDPDWPRVDRIVYRRPTDFVPRIGTREFLLGGTYDGIPAALTPVEAFDDTFVRQSQKVLIAPDNKAYLLCASGSGTGFDLEFTQIASDRLSALVAATPIITDLTSKAFDAAVDDNGAFHVVYVKSGNICYRKFDADGSSLVTETVIDTQTGACDNPRVSIDPGNTKVFVVYQALMGPSNNQIFFTSRTLAGSLITAPKNLNSSAQNLITPDIFVSDDLYAFVVWENDTLGSIVYRRFDDIGDALDAAATTVSADVEQIGVGTLSHDASNPRVLVAANRELIIAFRQNKGGSAYGITIYTGGAAFMQELTAPAESFLSFDIATDPIFNSVMLTAVQASSVDFVKMYGTTVSFVLNLQASGSRGAAVARDRLGSLLHAVSGAPAGTFTSYDATTAIVAFGAASVLGGVSTVNVDANQFLVVAASLSMAPDIDDRVVITGSAVGGNNSTRLITNVELMSLDAVDDVYRITVQNNFTAAEEPSTANGDFQAPDPNNAVYIKSVSESQDQVFGLFELPSDILLSRMLAPGTAILNWLPPGSAGDLADFLVIGGSGTIDWGKTSVGSLTLTGTVNLTNIFTATPYTIAPGSYPMTEGDALYVVLDPSDLAPTPIVEQIPLLPWNEMIGVIGIIVDGRFEPSMGSLRPMIVGEERVLGESLSISIKERLGVQDDVDFDAYSSTEHMNEADSYPEALSNLDTAVQNIFGQIQMRPMSPISKRVAVSASDKTLLKGSVFGIKYKDRLVDFDGAIIDFGTGSITEVDGTTPLGENFTPVVPAAGMWRWYAVNLLPGVVTSENRLSVKLKVTAAGSDGATKSDAPRATFTNQPDVGQVAVFSSDGAAISNIDYSNLLHLLTNFSSSEGSGGSANQILVSGSTSYDWEASSAGEFTFSAGLRIQDLSIGVTWVPVAGGYAMAEGEALYVVLDTTALTPTPQVAAITALPVTQNIFVIGAIRDGLFVPTAGSLETLESGETRDFGESLSTIQRARLGFVSDTQVDAYTSVKNINLNDNYPEAISNLDTVIAQILEQVQIVPKSPNSSRVAITGAYKTLLNGSVLGMQVENLLVSFDGAEIDFETGEVFEADGTSSLDFAFTPIVPAAGQWRWFAISLESADTDAENKLAFKVIVTPAAADGASQTAAPRAEFDSGPKIGQVAITSADGSSVEDIDQGNIVNLLTLDVGGGGGSTLLKGVAGENLAENDLVYISPGNASGDTGRTQGRLYLVDAGNASPALAEIRSQAVGFVLAAAISGADVKAALGSTRKNFVGLTPGVQYYADPTTPGAITVIKPSGDGQWIVPVGVPRSATMLDINPSMSSDAELIAVEAAPTDFDVTQTAHGFAIGDAVYFDGTDWQFAQADSAYTLAVGIVKEVADANNFSVRVVGPVEGLSGLTPGAYYFVSETTPGSITDNEPVVPYFSNPVGFALSATQLMVLPLRPGTGGANSLTYFHNALAGENLTVGDLVYLSPGTVQGDTSRTQGRLYLCDAGNADPALAAIRSRAIGICSLTALAGVMSQAQIGGLKNGLVGIVPGYLYYADPASPGDLTATEPTTVGDYIVPVGFGISVTELYINPAIASRVTLIEAPLEVIPTASFTAGENLTANDLVYVSPGASEGDTGRTAGEVYKCDAGNSDATLAAIRSQAIGFVTGTVLSGAAATVRFSHVLAGFTSLTPGLPYYADPSTPGAVTDTKPSTLGHWIVPVGLAPSATEILVNPSIAADTSVVALQSGIETVSGLAGEGLTANELVYLSPGNADGDTGRTAGSYYKVDAGHLTLAAIRSQAIGFVQATVLSGATVTVQRNGPMSGFSSLVTGKTYYADPASAGALTATKPTTVGQFIVPVGFARSATDIQLNPGMSSDATEIAAGGGGGLSAPVEKTGAYTMVSGDRILGNTNGGAFTLTLPSSPSVGDEVEIWDAQSTWGVSTKNLTVGRNGQNIEGVADDFIGNVSGSRMHLIFMGGTRGWGVFI